MEHVIAETEEEIRKNGNENLFSDSDVDEEALSNLLASYSMQEGVEGPVSSILTSLGIHLPQTRFVSCLFSSLPFAQRESNLSMAIA